MIVIDNIKYACQKCIKGHRSSRCDHTDRNLMVVKRKGRPISQCDECREQRKKRQIHQKCVCSSSSSTSKKEFKKYLVVAATTTSAKDNNNSSNNSSSSVQKSSFNLSTSRHIMSIEALLL